MTSSDESEWGRDPSSTAAGRAGEVARLLEDRRWRLVLEQLAAEDDQRLISVAVTLTDELATEPNHDSYRELYLELYHELVPLLVEHGLAEFDEPTGRLRMTAEGRRLTHDLRRTEWD